MTLKLNRSGWMRRFFTLPEAVIACAICGVGLASAVTLISFNLWVVHFAEVRMASMQIAKNRLEQVRLLGFSDLPTLAETNVKVNAQGLPAANGLYTRTTVLTGPDDQECYQVTVTVTAATGHGRPPVTVSMDTLVLDKNQVVMGG
ncbi:MAG: hypothetical protein WC708_08870 [Lentisphaeria bacterium]